jgi:hypothetical protein
LPKVMEVIKESQASEAWVFGECWPNYA